MHKPTSLFGSFNANGSGSAVSQRTNQAVEAAKRNPSVANWDSLLAARWAAATAVSGYDAKTATFTAAGKAQLTAGTVAWTHYLRASHGKPGFEQAMLAAGIYQSLSEWAQAASVWNLAAQTATRPERVKAYLCLALSSYAAKRVPVGQLAATEALKAMPAPERAGLRSMLAQDRSSAALARQGLPAAGC